MSLRLWLLRGAVDENVSRYDLSCCPILEKVFIRRLLMNLRGEDA